MVDDLITQPTTDPYRMFTSRSEYRLLLREDNADQRLTEIGRNIGLVSDERWDRFQKKQDEVTRIDAYLQTQSVTSRHELAVERFGLQDLKSGITLHGLLKRPDVTLDELGEVFPDLCEFTDQAREQAEIAIKYAGYIQRQSEQVERFREIENVSIATDIDYRQIPNLSSEVREKLERYRPLNLGQASRIQGVTPAAVAVLHVYLHKQRHAR